MADQLNSYGMLEVDLPEVATPLLQTIRGKFEEIYLKKFGTRSGTGLYRKIDWQRLEFATRLIPDPCASVLDVGVGPGAFLNYLTLSQRFSRVTGIDKRHFSKFVKVAPELDYRIMDIGRTTFPDRHFDLVFCMEVLEHLDSATLAAGLSELRRIAEARLVMTVPFNEPLPLPSYHLQHFDAARIRAMFPTAQVFLLHRNQQRSTWPWAVLVEDP